MASTSYSSTPVLSHIGLVHGNMASLLWQTSLLSRQCHAALHIDGYVHRYARYIGVVRLGGCFVTNSPPIVMVICGIFTGDCYLYSNRRRLTTGYRQP